MKIAIAGAGLTGAYLYRRLRETQDVSLFDLKKNTRCGLTPCAWGTLRAFEHYPEKAGLVPSRFATQVIPTVSLNGVPVSVNLVTFDKPSFIEALLDGAPVNTGPLDPKHYDRLIDATGVRRAFLPSLSRDLSVPGIQYRVETQVSLPARIVFVKIGYAWCFPLSGNRYHIGCACLNADPSSHLEKLGWMADRSDMQVICSCEGNVRIASVQDSRPFVVSDGRANIWGVGEAIGCVSPLVGEGIVPGLRSVEILLEHWDDPVGYTSAILNEFHWMREERQVVDRLIGGKRLTIHDAWVIKKNSKRMDIKVTLRNVLTAMWNLGKRG